jgi:hypothetical protein
MNKLQSAVILSKVDNLVLSEKSYGIHLSFKGEDQFDIGTMFIGGERNNKISIGTINGSQAQEFMRERYNLSDSDSGTYKVTWFNLNDDNELMEFVELLKVIHVFKDMGLRKLGERH